MISSDEKKKLLFEMLRIRRIQEKIENLYLEDQMKTPIHLYIGQEAIAVGISAHLNDDDFINSNHRSHGHYLAKGGDLKGLIAELFGKETGCSRGRGGSMHLIDVNIGHMGSSAIVGGGIPIATGMGLAFKMAKESRVSVAYFGDGAADEGVLYESINFAILKRLPVLYVLENNQYSVCSHVTARHFGDNVFHYLPEKFLPSKKINGNDVLEVYSSAQEAMQYIRAGKGPYFIECETYRIRGHAGCISQDFKGYRANEEVSEWMEKCPIKMFQQLLFTEHVVTNNELFAFEKQIAQEIEDAFDFAQKSPFPTPDSLEENLFSGDTDALVKN